MTEGAPVTTVAAIRILLRLALRRLRNRLATPFSGSSRRQRGKSGGPGKRRSRTGVILLICATPLFLYQCTSWSAQILARLAETLEASESGPRTMLRGARYRRLASISNQILTTQGPSFAGTAEERGAELTWQRQRLRELFVEELLRAPRFAHPREGLNETGKRELKRWLERFDERGIYAFERGDTIRAFQLPGVELWPREIHHASLRRAFAVLLTLLYLATLFGALGTANRDLGHVEWSFEWLFSFPVPTRSLFLAKLLEYTLIAISPWFTIFPLLFAWLFSSGHGWAALPWALLATLALSALVAGPRLVVETVLRKMLSPARLKNLQAVCTLLGVILLYSVMYVAISRGIPSWFSALAAGAPDLIAWLPWSLPAQLTRGGPWTAGILVALLGVVFTCSLLAIWICTTAVRTGLLAAAGPYRGARDRTARRRRRRRLLPGTVVKELRLLVRDHSFFTQTLILPFLMIGFQILLHDGWLDGVADDFRHAGATAFGIGAYMLLFGATTILRVEGGALWLLYTFPRRLASILRQKTALWGGIAMIYVGALLIGLAAWSGAPLGDVAQYGTLAIAGVSIFAFIAGGLGVLGFRAKANEFQRIRPATMYLCMLVASMFAGGFYTGDAWARVVLVILYALLAYAIWQKVHDHLPYLLDDSAAPPPRIGLSDGLIAILVFFVLQGALMAIFSELASVDRDLSLGGQLALSYVIAGGLVTVFTLALFRGRGTPWPRNGLELAGQRVTGWSRAIVTGALMAVVPIAGALLYLLAIENLPALEVLRSDVHEQQGIDARWLVLLAVIAAPLFEEFLFRGLVYQGLARSLPGWIAILASSGLFAVVHPWTAVLPVFLLGVAAALSLRSTGRLVAPIVTHSLYNAVVLGVQVG